jgi:hypothetical protein
MVWPGLKSVTVPKLSVVVVVVSAVPVEVVVEEVSVCAYATEPIRAVANVILRNNLIIIYFLSYQVAAVIPAIGQRARVSEGIRQTR